MSKTRRELVDNEDDCDSTQVRRLQKAKVAVARATERYEALKAAVSPEVVQTVEGPRDIETQAIDIVLEQMDEEIRFFDSEAQRNANNVTRDRVKHFLTTTPGVMDALRNYVFGRGLTAWDMEAMLEQMHGNPTPVVIKPEEQRPLDYVDALDMADSGLDTDDEL